MRSLTVAHARTPLVSEELVLFVGKLLMFHHCAVSTKLFGCCVLEQEKHHSEISSLLLNVWRMNWSMLQRYTLTAIHPSSTVHLPCFLIATWLYCSVNCCLWKFTNVYLLLIHCYYQSWKIIFFLLAEVKDTEISSRSSASNYFKAAYGTKFKVRNLSVKKFLKLFKTSCKCRSRARPFFPHR